MLPSARVLVVTLLAALAALAVGCGGGDSSSNGDAGSGGSNGGENTAPIKIGFIGAITGDGAFVGSNAQKGALGAVEMINAEGGIDGRQLELVSRDSQGEPAEALAAAREFAADEEILAVVGPDLSSNVEAAAPALEQAGLPHYIITSAIHPAPNSFQFAAYNGPEDTIKPALEHLRDEKGVKHIAVLASNDETGQVNVDVVQKLAPELGLDVTVERFDLSATDVAPQIRRLSNANPDGYYVTVTGAAFGVAMRGLGIAGELDKPVIGYASNTVGDVLKDMLAELEPSYLIFQTWKPTVWEQLPDDDPQKEALNVLAEYTDVNMLTAGGWDGVQLWAAAMRAALEDGEEITRQTIRDHAQETTLVGAVATAKMTPENHRGTSPEDTPVVQWVDTSLKLVDTQ